MKAPRAQLERVARELYQEHIAQQVPAKVRNASAPAALGEHRAFRFRGHAYRVPPLPWRDGYSLLVAKHNLVLEDAEPGIRAVIQERALRVVRRVLRRAVRRPLSRRIFTRSPWRDLSVAEAIHIIDTLLYVPDETPLPATSGARVIDLLDGLVEFCHALPAWVNERGEPLSWAHYQHGCRWLARHVARESLRAAQAARIAQASRDDFKDWATEVRSVAGW